MPTELLQPGFFCKERLQVQAIMDAKVWPLATSVIELFHGSDVACHHGDTLTGQAGMETADKSEAS